MTMKWMLLAISSVIIVIYSIFLRRWVKAETPFISWLTTLLSVVVAAFLGIFIFFFQNAQTDAQDKNQHRILIKEELRSNLDDLNGQEQNRLVIIRGGVTNTVCNIDLQCFCMTQAIQSRLFDEEETRQLYIMVNAIHKRKTLLAYLGELLQYSNNNPDNIWQVVAALNKMEEAIIKNMDELKRTLAVTK